MKLKVISGIVLALFLIGMLILAFNVQPVKAEPKTWTVDDDGPADFHTIQEAINAANLGDTIFVSSGTYYENVVVNKTVLLVGENRDTTIIDGNFIGNVINVTANNVHISGFTIRNSAFRFSGIYMEGSNCNNISYNIIANNAMGIGVYESSNNTISENNVTANEWGGIGLAYSTNNIVYGNNVANNEAGIGLYESSNNIIFGNNVTANTDGISLYYSSNNSVSKNNIENNKYGIFLVATPYKQNLEDDIINNRHGIFFHRSSNNSIYHNNFINNGIQVNTNWVGVWDDGYPSGGNYWSDYNGTDANQDGIGDTPYIINEDNTDNYPLMGMFSDFPISSIGGYKLEETCHVTTISNSTIEGFELFIIVHIGTGEWVGGGIFLNVTGPEGTKGFCRFTIPKDLLDCPEGLEYWTVYLDGTDVTLSCNMWENSTHTFIYVPYNHSTQLWLEGTWIVPEFPTWTSILLILIVLTVAIAIYKRRLPKTTIH